MWSNKEDGIMKNPAWTVRLYNVGSKYIESRWNPNYNFVVKHDKIDYSGIAESL